MIITLQQRRTARDKMIEEAQASANKAAARGQFKAAAKHQEKVGRLPADYPEA